MRSNGVYHWSKTSKISDITVSRPIITEIKKSYKNIPSFHMEFGGIICGKKQGGTANITKLAWIPSLSPSPTSYSFQDMMLNYRDLYCGNDDVVGLFHTHSPDVPLPSSTDIMTSKQLDTIGCVVAPQHGNAFLNCFRGNTRVRVHQI